MAAASEYVLEPIRDSAEFTRSPARQPANPLPALPVASAADQPPPHNPGRLSTNTRSRPNLRLNGLHGLGRSCVPKEARLRERSRLLPSTFWNGSTATSRAIRYRPRIQEDPLKVVAALIRC